MNTKLLFELEQLRKIEVAARGVYTRWAGGKTGEDANIFAEWDDLGDALHQMKDTGDLK